MEALKRRQQQVEEQKKKTEVREACFVPFCDFLTCDYFAPDFGCLQRWLLIQWIDSEIKNYIHSKG